MRVDEEFMEEVGLGAMPEEEKRAFMEHAEEELEVRVGQGIGMNMSDEQLREFDEIADAETAAQWLDRNVPNYRELVAEIFAKFKREIAAERQKILGM